MVVIGQGGFDFAGRSVEELREEFARSVEIYEAEAGGER